MKNRPITFFILHHPKSVIGQAIARSQIVTQRSARCPSEGFVREKMGILHAMGRVVALWVIALGTVCGWQPGTSDSWATEGFSVDRSNRRDVLAFYHCVYGASLGFREQHGWTGNLDTCVEGTVSAVFQDDVMRRVNFHRALAGLPADIYFTSAKSTKSQKAALMMSKASQLSHYPSNTWPCYTAEGAEAAGASNLALGNYGPDAVDAYMHDRGDNNRAVGHRRWILYPRAQEMATGDIPPLNGQSAANALWVIGQWKPTPQAAFHAWPNSGYFPHPLMPARWSLSYPGANFSSATVSMSVGNVTVPVSVVSSADNGIGDNSLVWEPLGLPGSLTQDVSYRVSVSGIGGGGPTSRIYTVTLFNPNVLGDKVEITGPAEVPLAGGSYTFNAIDQADEYELEVAQLDGGPWVEGAEDSPLPRIEETVSTGYNLRQTGLKRTGAKAFQLTYPGGAFSDQSFIIARDLIPTSTSRFLFHDRARFTTVNTTLEAQVSEDGGGTWATVFSRSGVGGNSTLWDGSWISRDISLSAYAGKVINVRIRMTRNGGSVYQGVSDSYGFFIDDITITGGVQITAPHRTSLQKNSSSFALDASTAGQSLRADSQYFMRIRPNVGCRWFESGPYKIIRTSALPIPEIAVERSDGTNLVDGTGTVSFGNVVPATGKQQTFRIRNIGNAKLSGIIISKTGTHAAEFTVTSHSSTVAAPGGSIAPGGFATFVVNFMPTSAGTKSALIRIASNDADENPFDINFTGSGVSPEIAVEKSDGTNLVDGASTVSFGNVVAGAAKQQSFRIRNTGNANLTGILISKTGTHAAEFTVTSHPSTVVAPGGSLVPGKYATFVVNFTPTSTGSKTATLRIASNDANENPFDINFTGSGVSPEIAVGKSDGTNLMDGTSTVSFGNVMAGTSNQQSFRIRNLGNANLSGIVISKTGTHAAEFTVTSHPSTMSAPGGAIAPGGFATFSVTFRPSSPGTKTAAIRIASNDANENPFDINLTGTGLTGTTSFGMAAKVAVVDSTSQTLKVQGKRNFRPVRLGPTGKVLAYAIQLPENTLMDSVKMRMVGEDASNYQLITPTRIQPSRDGRLTFQVAFHPLSEGTKNATIRISGIRLSGKFVRRIKIKGAGSDTSVPAKQADRITH